MERLNKKGFTLVELLSVIVILSVVILIATNAVLPAANNAKKEVLAGEANFVIQQAGPYAAKDGVTTSKCYSFQDLKDAGVVEKRDDAYHGSLLITIDDKGKTNYKVWLSNGTFMIDGVENRVESSDVKASGENASDTCGLSN